MSDDSALRMAAEQQQKFNFYLVGLTFGVLALSVQTAKFDGALIARCAELVGWVSLLVSGGAGLLRLETLPHIHALFAHEDEALNRAHQYVVKKEEGFRTVQVTREGREYPIDHLISTANQDAKKLKDALEPLKSQVARQYVVQKTAFVLGLAGLVVSRGYAPLMGIVQEWHH